jgi:hypothetical protein
MDISGSAYLLAETQPFLCGELHNSHVSKSTTNDATSPRINIANCCMHPVKNSNAY